MLDVIYLMKQIFWKKKIEEQVTSSNCGFYIGKRVMCLSVELLFTPTEAIAKILFNTIEEFLQSKKYLIRLVGILVIRWTSLPG